MVNRSVKNLVDEYQIMLDKKENDFIELKKMVAELTTTIEKIKDDTYFVRKIYTAPKQTTSKKKLSKEETTLSLLNKITKRGKKV